jgi:2-phospho-L-lactate guanylyltransferase
MSTWAVVPVKPFGLAKQRLAACMAPRARALLARLMLQDVLDVLHAVPALTGVLVVTADAQAAALARQRGARVLAEPEPAGLNPALAAAAAWLQQQGASGMLIVPGDAPGMTTDEIEHLLRRRAQGAAVSIAPAHDLQGTNALLLSPPQAMPPAFGEGSFHRHQQAAQAAGLTAQVVLLPGLALDLDQPRDLACFATRHAAWRGTRAGRYLQACGLGGAPPRPASALTRSRPCPAPSTLRTAAS